MCTTRRQPLLPAARITGYGTQGLTLEKAVVDLAYAPPEAGSHAMKGPYTYVAMLHVPLVVDLCIVCFDMQTLTKKSTSGLQQLEWHLDSIKE